MLNQDLSKLMFKVEHFPIKIEKMKNLRGQEYYGVICPPFPPCHPSLIETDIDIDLAVSLLEDVLEVTALELRKILDKIDEPYDRFEIRRTLDKLTYNIKTRKIDFGHTERIENGISIRPFPIIEGLFIGKNIMNSYGYAWGDHLVSIHKSSYSFFIPKNVVFSSELLKEYQLEDEGIFGNYRWLDSSYGWYSHNLDTIDRLFFRNLIMAIDNETTKRKYTE
jgi:hypothetical protein